jgi:uncharacterized SAM-binding protein YcdF (DUF218 family)
MKASRNIKIITIALSIFLAWVVIAPFLAEALIVEKPLEKADAIMVLGGSSTFVERTQKAAELYRQGIAPKIYLTDDGGRGGWSRIEHRNPKFVERARNNLIEQGVPADSIEVLASVVEGTIDEARLFANKAEAENLKSVLLVTSAYHTRRARWVFERVLIGRNIEIGIGSPPPGIQTPPPFYWWLLPSGWSLVASEYIKGAYYWACY